MLMLDLLETVALTSLAALAIAAGTVAVLGAAVLGLVALAGSLAARRAGRTERRATTALRPATAS
ncbi:hypothetical protein OVA14_05215 [Agrococcus sp. SL85]|uniref:hypothetical protein n=1 Tax=Agrococcus sp. SL85 TaxID=2995141 RepID=UPI00226D2A24|nr:hypothetical protein [Agrococcus sp. SL85]WAC67145.1 hypothetical protein OVA14_05215 [Agrococcus sp. SL85]